MKVSAMAGYRIDADAGCAYRLRRIGCFVKPDYVIVGFLFALIVLVYLRKFQYLTHDDLFFIYADNGTYALGLANFANGRLVPGSLFYLISAIGQDIQNFDVLLQGLACFAFAAFALIFVKKISRFSSASQRLICSSVIVLFPYNTPFLMNGNNFSNAFLLLPLLSVQSISIRIEIFTPEFLQRLFFCLFQCLATKRASIIS